MTRHEFLAALHALLDPTAYLEIGVHYGDSLRLARPGCRAVGVDPNPQVPPGAVGSDAAVVALPSDAFWTTELAADLRGRVDLAFVDGLHHVDQVVRDVRGVESLAAPGAVLVLDDVLPRNHAEAARAQCPGDWTGDVYKITDVLGRYRPDLSLMLVDVQPTGALVVTGLDPGSRVLYDEHDEIVAGYVTPDPQAVPDRVLRRLDAVSPSEALGKLEAHR